jgi:predicted dehydrogenase
MTQPTRREFISTSAKSVATVATVSALSTQTQVQATEKPLRVAVIGTGNQGSGHARVYNSMANAELVAICDLDPTRRAKIMGELTKSPNVKATDNFEDIINDTSIEAVSIATPDHWHTPLALHALKAGKHVYVEKPCSHNIYEAKVLGEATKKTGLCVQHGTHSRASKGIQDAMAFIRSGKMGTIRMAKAINHQKRGPIGKAPERSIPEGVNYDRWLGPAPNHAFTPNRWHYNWHWFWDYGGGDMVNDGIHQVDQALWGLGVGLPNRITGSAAQLWYQDDHETPDTQTIVFEYDNCHLLYEMRLWTGYKLEGHDNGVVFYGDKGKVTIGRKGCFYEFIGEVPVKIGDGANFRANIQNFITAARANDPSLLQGPIEEGILSSTLCNMGNIVGRIGRSLDWDNDLWAFKNDDEANALIKRMYRKGYELPVV